MMKKAKETYCKTTLQNKNKNWQVLNWLGSKTTKSNTSLSLAIDGTVNFGPKEVAAKFNSFSQP